MVNIISSICIVIMYIYILFLCCGNKLLCLVVHAQARYIVVQFVCLSIGMEQDLLLDSYNAIAFKYFRGSKL